MSEITTPVFTAHGSDDKVCHIDGSTKFNDTIASADKTFKVFITTKSVTLLLGVVGSSFIM